MYSVSVTIDFRRYKTNQVTRSMLVNIANFHCKISYSIFYN